MAHRGYKDGTRVHIFLRRCYLQKILDNKVPGETNTEFIERAIDYMIESKDSDLENFKNIQTLFSKLADSSEEEPHT